MTNAQFSRETGKDGSWQRQQSAFRRWIGPDGDFPAAPGRYHLYVCAACPWAHRAIIVRSLKGLEDVIAMTVVDPLRDERGWRFGAGDATTGDRDPLHGWTYLSEAYHATDASFDARVTVPVIWDTEMGSIVNNESSEVIRILGSEFDEWAARPDRSLYPEAHRAEIDEINEWVYSDVNNGVYRCGFATTQSAYDESFNQLFTALDRLERILESQRYLVGSELTEADVRLFTTLVRFDPVYHGHFKCNRQTLQSFPSLWAYTRDIFQTPGIADTVNIDHIKRHYYMTHDQINPTRIVPAGPRIDYLEPHGREHVGR